MRKVVHILTWAGILLTAWSAFAESSVRAYVERTVVSKGTPFALSVEINGSSIGDVKLPEIENVNVTGTAGNNSQTRVEMTGAKVSVIRSQTYRYVLQATRAGKLTIPAINVQVDGKTLSTDPIVMDITEGSVQTSPQQNTTIPDQQADQDQTSSQSTGSAMRSQRQPTWDDAVFVESSVDKHDVFQGEPVTLTLSLWRLNYGALQVDVNRKSLAFPAPEGFYTVPLEPTSEMKERNGFQYEVTQFRQILYPTVSGNLKINPWQCEAVAQYGFNGQNFSLQTKPITINASPLPQQPQNFSGAVGSFHLQTQMSNNDVIQGTPVKLVLRVTGRGNPDAIGAPTLPKIENAHVSDPEKDSKPIDTRNALGIEKTFTYTITPLEEGTLNIPAIEFCYFDPNEKTYKTEKSDPIAIHILKSTESTSRTLVSQTLVTPESGHVDVVGDDILTIVTDASNLQPTRNAGVLMPIMALTPMFTYVGLCIYMHRKRRFTQDTGYARTYFAHDKTAKRLQLVTSSSEPTEELFRAVSDYIADKFNTPTGGMTSSDVRQILESNHIDTNLTEGFVKILRSCERARYASATFSPDEITNLTQDATNAIDALEGILKKTAPTPRVSL